MASYVFNDMKMRALQPASKGRREDHWDALVPGFGVRITDTGRATFIVMRRIKGKTAPVRRIIGHPFSVPLPKRKKGDNEKLSDLGIDLGRLRTEARAALEEMGRGIDPKARRQDEVREARRREDEARRVEANTFALAARAFITDHVAKLKSRKDVAASIERELIARWGDRPVGDITHGDIIRMLREVKKTRPYQARNLFAYCNKFFKWAIASEEFGLEVSPCARVQANEVIGRKSARDRVLENTELVQVWRATQAPDLGLPYGAFIRMLLLTGQRLHEVADMVWSEIDQVAGLWTIGAARMKGGIAHTVPLAPAALALLSDIPRGTGPYVFSTTGGRRPIAGFSKIKRSVDARLADVEPWRFHDLRRTMRTHLGGLPVPANVAELVIAHAQPGMHRIYDRWAYADEKRRALELWAERLLSIVEPDRPAKVVRLLAAR